MSTVPKEYLDLLPVKDLSTVLNDTERNAQWLHDTKARGKQKGVKYADKLKVLIPELKKRLAKTKDEDEKTAIEAAIAKAEGALMSGYTRASTISAAKPPRPPEMPKWQGMWEALPSQVDLDVESYASQEGVELEGYDYTLLKYDDDDSILSKEVQKAAEDFDEYVWFTLIRTVNEVISKKWNRYDPVTPLEEIFARLDEKKKLAYEDCLKIFSELSYILYQAENGSGMSISDISAFKQCKVLDADELEELVWGKHGKLVGVWSQLGARAHELNNAIYKEALSIIEVYSKKEKAKRGPEHDFIVYRFDGTNNSIAGASGKGMYVAELVLRELSGESAELIHCIGNPNHGHPQLLANGFTQVFSIRTTAGKSKFTIELFIKDGNHPQQGLVRKETVTEVKGYNNRIPGFEPGKTEMTKPDEVRLVVDFLVNYLKMTPAQIERTYDIRAGVLAMKAQGIDPFSPPPVRKRPPPAETSAKLLSASMEYAVEDYERSAVLLRYRNIRSSIEDRHATVVTSSVVEERIGQVQITYDPSGDFIAVYEISSLDPGKGNAQIVLEGLRDKYNKPIHVVDPGDEGTDSRSFWDKMKSRSVIESMEDGEGRPINAMKYAVEDYERSAVLMAAPYTKMDYKVMAVKSQSTPSAGNILASNDAVWYHGSPSGELRGSHYGLHIGTFEAARDALEARLGRPQVGDWDGKREYGDTPLYPHGITPKQILERLGIRATYSGGEPVAMSSKPVILKMKIVGEMSNTPYRPHNDSAANSRMASMIKKGTAKRGYYYINEAEDEGSISAVVPDLKHVAVLGPISKEDSAANPHGYYYASGFAADVEIKMKTAGDLSASVIEAAPYDGWKDLKPGKLPTPVELEDAEGLWKAIAERIGHDVDKGVEMRAPIIGGRKRYHHRPLRSYHLSNNRTLTVTTDEMEAKTWNNLKAKRHPSMPRIYDVFSIKKKGEPKAKLWAIVHEQLTWPVEKDWDLFVDSFFKWRAMEREALSPAKATDLEGFLRWVIDPETADPKTTQKHRIEVVLPWKMTRQRRDDVADRRKKLFALPDLEEKIKWAKSALKYLHQNKVHFRDFDPSNLAMTVQGDRAVITNLAESRSIPTKTGRTGRVKGSTVEELERMDIKDLDRMAFGVVDDEVIELDPKEIRIQYHSDLDNPKDKFRTGGYNWLKSVDFTEPVDVEVHQDGHFYLADGHHRWFAASKLGRKLRCKVVVKANPVKFLTEGPSAKVR